ncbi:site-specific integrase [bacterium]|nr:site-specific integrase [bacterium]
MVRVFRKNGSKNYYFQVMINGRRIVESTRTSSFRKASKIAEERTMELKLDLDWYFYLKQVIKKVNLLDPEAKEAALRSAIEELNGIKVKTVTLEEAFGLFRTKPRKRTISERVYEDYRNLWCKFVGFVNNNFHEVKFLSEINKVIAEKFLSSEWERGITERTYNDRITKFRTIFSALAEDAGLRKNVWQSVDKMSEGPVSKRPFSKAQLKQIFLLAGGSMRTLCMIGLYTGLRLGDAATLKWEEVDFENSLISRLPNKTRKLRKNVEIPLLGGLREELERIRAGRKSGEIYILPDIAGKYLSSPIAVSGMVQALFRKAGIETITDREGCSRKCVIYGFHSFRHSFVSLCAANGIPMNVVMELVGHRSVMVHEIYQHASAEQKIKAINVIENEFRGKDQ